jgi:hypothetical protein
MMYLRTDPRDTLLLAMPPAAAAFPTRGSAIARTGERRRRPSLDLAIAGNAESGTARRRPSSDLVIAPGHCRRCRPSGMGDAATATQATQIAGSAASPVVSAVAGTSVASILGVSTAVAIPIIGAAIAGVTLLAVDLIKNSGCGQTCIETSQWANQAEPVLQQNIQAYFSNPAPRSQSQQNAALANFDAVWARLVQMCSDPSTGDAGKRCISDRQSGACTWHQSTAWVSLNIPGEPQPGECWNWWSGYRDPISSDPDVVPDSVSSVVTGAASSAMSELSSLPSWAWAVAALAIVAVML